MSFDLEKLQAVAELGEVIRLQNEALDRLKAFRKARPYMMMPNLAKMVEENLKENVMVLYKELNNLHKPAEEQVRYICRECHMAFIVQLPGGLCDECRARQSSGGPRDYTPYQGSDDEDNLEEVVSQDGAADQPDSEHVTTDDATPPREEDTVEAASRAFQGESIEDAYAAAIAGGDDPDAAPGANTSTDTSAEPAETSNPDTYDHPGDTIELASPAPDVAKPEGVEGVPDDPETDSTSDQRRT